MKINKIIQFKYETWLFNNYINADYSYFTIKKPTTNIYVIKKNSIYKINKVLHTKEEFKIAYLNEKTLPNLLSDALSKEDGHNFYFLIKCPIYIAHIPNYTNSIYILNSCFNEIDPAIKVIL